jgi:hypothetical protein
VKPSSLEFSEVYDREVKHNKSPECPAFNFHENPPKSSTFSKAFHFEPSQKEKTEDAKGNWYNLGLTTSRNFSPTKRRSTTLNENASPNVGPFYPMQSMTSDCSHDHIIKRKVDSFELNIFQDAKRTRKEEVLLSRSTSIVYQGKEKYLQSKHIVTQTRQKPNFRNVVEQVTYIVLTITAA